MEGNLLQAIAKDVDSLVFTGFLFSTAQLQIDIDRSHSGGAQSPELSAFEFPLSPIVSRAGPDSTQLIFTESLMERTRFIGLALFLPLSLVAAIGQAVNFGVVDVGTAGSTRTITYNFSSPTTLSAVNVLTAGASGLDYTDGGGSTCTAGTAYDAGQSCTVTVAFTPSAPGLRAGGVILFAEGTTLPFMSTY